MIEFFKATYNGFKFIAKNQQNDLAVALVMLLITILVPYLAAFILLILVLLHCYMAGKQNERREEK